MLQNLHPLDIRGTDGIDVALACDHADITAIAGATVAMYMLGLRVERLARSS